MKKPEKKPAARHVDLAPLEDPRALELSLARTAYNYMRTYPNLANVPLCASVPASEAFTPDFKLLVARSSTQIAENFLTVARGLMEGELKQDATPLRMYRFMEDLETLFEGVSEVAAEALVEGPTAFLKSTMFDILRKPHRDGFLKDKDFLQAEHEAQYAALIQSLPPPLMLTTAGQEQPSGSPQHMAAMQDWFFGYLQVAGFNTTNLRGVVSRLPEGSKAIVLSDLQKKMGFADQQFDALLGNRTLQQAVDEGRIFACDYTPLLGAGKPGDHDSYVHGKQRFMPGPIALFYWNDAPPAGYPKDDSGRSPGALQPIAIQLEANGHIFVPSSAEALKKGKGWAWQIAKYFVNVACAIQHESVAHLGDCHFIMESIVVATHRQLTQQHPVHRLLAPHMRFTLSINGGALSNLVVPKGVVATNVGPDIHWTLELVNQARDRWRWNENHPEQLFKLRGVDAECLPSFPFRDDTLLLWKATRDFVAAYVAHEFEGKVLADDAELMAWFRELTAADGGNLQGLTTPTNQAELVDVLAQVIYTAGPLHAAVNYAQYPLGAYMPSVSATVYAAPPRSDEEVNQDNYLNWFPPLDIALYTLSFEYLLSSVQYDVFGHYAENRQFPYFEQAELERALQDFQCALAEAENEIMKRNRLRPMPYPFQLPSRIPNSISI